MSEDRFPLYPDLSEEGEIEAQKLIDAFKENLREAAREVIDETITELYCDILPHIQSDSWGNFRRDLMEGLLNYNNRKIQGDYDFKDIRQQIYKEYREDIIKDLDQDNLEEIKKLKEQIDWLNKCR